MSEPVWTEYEALLRRPELKSQPAEVERPLTELREVADFVSPTRTLAASPDESDNRFLEYASASRADYLVTGNKRHFPATYGAIEIVNTRELIQTVLPWTPEGVTLRSIVSPALAPPRQQHHEALRQQRF